MSAREAEAQLIFLGLYTNIWFWISSRGFVMPEALLLINVTTIYTVFALYIIGITPDQSTVHTEFYHGLRL